VEDKNKISIKVGKRRFGYIHVSSQDQNEGRQIQSMQKFGVSPRDLFIVKQSGRNFNHEQCQISKRMIRKGDIFYIHSLDSFGRPKAQVSEEFIEVYNRWKQKDITVIQAIKEVNMKIH